MIIKPKLKDGKRTWSFDDTTQLAARRLQQLAQDLHSGKATLKELNERFNRIKRLIKSHG